MEQLTKTQIRKDNIIKRKLARIQIIPKNIHKALVSLDAELDDMKSEIRSALAGKKISCQRIRLKTLALRSVFKDFRKLTNAEEKKK